jgi:hypothetical protein
LSDNFSYKSDDLEQTILAHHHFSHPSRINGTVSNDSTLTTAAGTSYI